ncbi:alpha/beta fold hydrolase [Streptomyces sp. NPDC004285]
MSSGTVAGTTARLLAATGSARWRTDLQAGLKRYPGRVHVVTGSEDPLSPEGRSPLDGLPHATVTVIAGAGHHPQLTHPEEVARAIRERTP